MLTPVIKNSFVLTMFACLSTALVVLTHTVTKDKIALHKQQALSVQLKQVFPPTLHDNDLSQSCALVASPQYLGTSDLMPVYIAKLNGQQSGLVIETIAPGGYNGAIRLLVGYDNYGRITGVRAIEHNETPGLGDKINRRVTDWIDGFAGKRLEIRSNHNSIDGATSATYRGAPNVQLASLSMKQWKVRKDGGQFEGFTGATITPRAVVKATKNSSLFFYQIARTIGRKPLNCGER